MLVAGQIQIFRPAVSDEGIVWNVPQAAQHCAGCQNSKCYVAASAVQEGLLPVEGELSTAAVLL